MRSTYGEILHLCIYGRSHGPSIGMILNGIPAGLPVDLTALQKFMDRRAPGRNEYSTRRKESDIPRFLSGITDGYTNGEPIEAVIDNQDVRTKDYEKFRDCPRPGHADYTAYMKYGQSADMSGGGHFSGRMTAPMCVAGGLCLQWLEAAGIQITAHIEQIGSIADTRFDPVDPKVNGVNIDFPVLNPARGIQMRDEILAARDAGDSLGGIIECAVVDLPAGLGDPMFSGMENRIAQIIYGIPAVKGLEFGNGFATAKLKGSENNDCFVVRAGKVRTLTNSCGGILGGITNGMPLIFRVAIKPTPSISLPQQSVNLQNLQEETISITGRHDPCIVPRAVPVVEAAAAIAIFDAYLSQEAANENK